MEGCDNEARSNGLCRRHYDLERHTGSPKPMDRVNMCVMCGGWFPLQRRTRRFCSDACRKQYNRLKKKGLAPRDIKRKPRQREPTPQDTNLTAPEFFTDSDVLLKCQGMCMECGGRIDPSISPAEPDGPASSWFLPLEQGGKPILDNRVALHLRCLKPWTERGLRGRKWKKGKQSHR